MTSDSVYEEMWKGAEARFNWYLVHKVRTCIYGESESIEEMKEKVKDMFLEQVRWSDYNGIGGSGGFSILRLGDNYIDIRYTVTSSDVYYSDYADGTTFQHYRDEEAKHWGEYDD
jgi:hypothetical protein